ncbi:Uncharacterised protein [Legionella pneumophila]|nr:Uncharacterised protein [Legionella pneumophila]CZR33154.1 Uncharacterised protein [Legionella pneumophila]
MRNLAGKPRHATTRSNTRITPCAGRLKSISIANTSRLKSSTMLNVLKRRPHINASHIKSIGQH